ncbi:MAG: type IV secretory system conjugative DNA transfer family protein [Clostridiales bacterium]|nr:type IV secretory system conjugative DNA transfer family protein [Clostridiales bacterium]MCF8022658.1 type IV secretory system conjugative DNA transfer family protein [Clostridiales bacterium]
MQWAARILKSKLLILLISLVVLYLLDAWLLGSFAVMLVDFEHGLELYGKPLKAAAFLPNSGAVPHWVIVNIVVFLLLAAMALTLYVRVPEIAQKFRFRNSNSSFIDDPSCGTAKWMQPSEVFKTLEKGHGPGILLGSFDKHPVRLYKKGRLNRNVMVFGAPGSGKTWSIIIPNALQAVTNKESTIVIDPKSEIARETLEFFRENNYNTRVFNLVDMECSDAWNPLDEVTDNSEAQLFTEVVIANTAVPGARKAGGDPFWDRCEQNLLKALTMYVKTEYPEENQTIYSIYNLLASGDTDALDLIFKGLDEDHPAKAPYNIYSQAGNNVKGGVIQGLGTRLQVFQNENVKKLTSTSTINLEAPGKKQCAYYCVVSDTDTTFDFLSSLFFSFLFIKLTKLGDINRGRCPVDVNFLLDEFCNIGAIPDFKKRIATMRSRGLYCTIITQSLPQLENRYPQKAWQEIISCCDSRLFLGVNDTDTAKYLSESLGEGTVEQRSIRRTMTTLEKAMVSKSPKSRRLMTMDETLRLDERKSILIVRGRNPAVLEKLPYTAHPLAKEIKPLDITDYRPERVENKDMEIEILWGVDERSKEEVEDTPCEQENAFQVNSSRNTDEVISPGENINESDEDVEPGFDEVDDFFENSNEEGDNFWD